jgi:hypothetical protein
MNLEVPDGRQGIAARLQKKRGKQLVMEMIKSKELEETGGRHRA